MPVQNAEIAAMFDLAAELLEIKGDNPFRFRAYRRAARTIESLPTSAAAMLASGEELSELPGVGEDLAGKIADIVKKGKFKLLEQLKREMPGGLAKLLEIPGIGPKRVKLLFDELGVRSLDDLRRAAKAGRLLELRGFGTKMEESILDALAKPKTATGRFKLPVAEAEALLDWVARGKLCKRLVVAGSFRRRQETVDDLDILATAETGADVGSRLAAYENTAQVLAHGPTRTTVKLRSGLRWNSAAFLLLAAALPSFNCVAAEDCHAISPPVVDEKAGQAATEVAVFAGGCFWGVQGVFQDVDGVSRRRRRHRALRNGRFRRDPSRGKATCARETPRAWPGIRAAWEARPS